MEPNPDPHPPDDSPSNPPSPPSQVDKEVRERERRRRTEVLTTVIMALSTIASSWCAYQSSLWNGDQTFFLVHSNFASREATELNVTAQQTKMVDASLLVAYLEARARGDKTLENLLLTRFRPAMRVATEAWLKTDPFNNPDAPAHPLVMKEYVQPEIERAIHKRDDSDELLMRAQEANQNSDRYVLLTVIFASVLFFGGVGATFSSAGVRIAMFYITLILFSFAILIMSFLPVTSGG